MPYPGIRQQTLIDHMETICRTLGLHKGLRVKILIDYLLLAAFTVTAAVAVIPESFSASMR
jgi:hypothetical protein